MYDLDLDGIPYAENIFHPFGRLKIYFRNVKQPFQILFNLNKYPEVSDVSHRAVAFSIGLIFAAYLIPRILCELFHPQSYPVVLIIHV